MMTAMQKPSIGRIVHYYGCEGDGPHAAIITKVRSDQCVDLYVLPQDGEPLGMFSVGNTPDDANGHWCWPPRI